MCIKPLSSYRLRLFMVIHTYIYTPCEPYSLYSIDLSSSIEELCSNSSLQQKVETCVSQNISGGHQCFWNPQSRITGESCNTCHESCQSEQKAMNFYQFGIGVLLISLSSPLGFVYISAITSDITSVESQVCPFSETVAT